MKYFKLTIYILIIAAGLLLGAADFARADYEPEGVIVSTDIASGLGAGWITGFTATTSVPASTTLGFLFSRDSEHWYNSRGEEGIWDSAASGTVNFDLRAFKWATSTLATTTLKFYYKARFTTEIATVTPLIYEVSMQYQDDYDASYETDNGLWTEGAILSTDLLDGIADEAWITYFTATSSIPASTTLGFLFSIDGENWYNSRGEAGVWDLAASGTSVFDLRALDWATTTLATSSLKFYYRAHWTTNIATVTPVLYEIRLDYSDVYSSSADNSGNYQAGAVVSANLLNGALAGTSTYFGYVLSDLPASTTAYIQFGTTTDYWYSASGTLWATTTLAAGDHLATSSAIDLSALNFYGRYFYYKILLSSEIGTSTPILSDVELYFTGPPPVEYTAVVDTGGVGDFSSLSAWENAIQSDLTLPTTRVFSFVSTTTNGTIPDGATVIGYTSGATAVAKHVNSVSVQGGTAQALFTGISGIFEPGEKVYIQGAATTSNYIYITDEGNYVIAVAKCRATGGLPDTTPFWIDGWTATSTNYIKIWTDPNEPFRHKGVWDDDKYLLSVSIDEHGIQINENYVTIDGLQIFSSVYSGRHAIQSYWSGTTIGETKISNNILKGRNAASSNAIYINADEPSYGYIWNNIIYDFNGTNSVGIYNNCSSASRYYAYNNSVYNSNTCFYNSGASSALLLKNNLSQNCIDGYDGTFNSVSDNNISDIAGDAPNATFATTAIEVLFEDEANYDFHLDSADTAAKNMGTTSVAEIGFTTDADNETRRGNFDIGADENVAKIYRSVGPSASTAIVTGTTNNHSNHLYISYASSTSTSTVTYAYFEYPLPDNIGVGDAIQFDSDNNGTIDSLAFIHKRLSSQAYKVYKLDATKATTTSVADIDWSIFRAYTSLSNAEGGTENTGLDDTVEQFDASWSASGGKDLTSATANEQWNIAAYANGTASDIAAVTIDQWTTSADNFIKIYTPTAIGEVGESQRHRGVWTTEKYNLEITDAAAITIDDDVDIQVDGLQVRTLSPTANHRHIFYALGTTDVHKVSLSNSILRGHNNSSYTQAGIITAGSGRTFRVWNNIIYDFAAVSGFEILYHISGTLYLYSNTFIGGYRLRISVSTVTAINNISDGSYAGFSGVWSGSSDYNTSDVIGDDVPGSHSQAGVEVSFVDAANYNYHVSPNDSTAKNLGADLSYDVYLPIKTDIDADTSCLLEPGNAYNDCGETRAYNTAYDIGADEVITPIYRSVGPNATTALFTGSSTTLTIASSSATSTATFGTYVPDNVGVGDAIQYDSDNNGTIDAIAFINYRYSSTQYGVTKYDGTPATSTTAADSDWAIYRAYTSLSNAEAGTENANINSVVQQFDSSWSGSGGKNIASSSEQWNVACYANGTTSDATSTIISGWTTAPQNYFKIYTPYLTSEVGVSQRHSGKWDENKYKLMSASGYRPIYNVVNFFRMEGLQISNDTLVDYGVGFISRPVGTRYYTEIRISENIITNSVSPAYRVMGLDLSYGAVYKVYNNILYNFNHPTSAYGIFVWNGQGLSDAYLYNNTIINSTYGIATGDINTVIARNNIIQGSGNTNTYNGTFSPGTDYNATDGTDNIGQGNNNRVSQTFTFLDEANDDFHLAQTDTAAKDAGMDLSNDPWLPIRTDIDSNNRPNSNFQNPNNKFDIGADEAATPIYRSVAPSATTVLTSGTSNAISINATTSTATFISGLPDNIGVGDVIQYDADNNGTIDSAAFIHGRTSSTTYTVKDWAGANPVSTIANDNDWGVYRAYTSLANAIGNRFYNEGEGGTENTGASSSINNFDTWSGYKDILTSNEQWNISTYANGTTADVESLEIKDWTTAPLNYLKIYTPTNINEVGTSQRHQGKWDESKYHMTVDDYFGNIYFSSGLINFWIDGLQLRETGIVDESGEMHGGIIDHGGNSDAYQRISNNIIRSDNGSASLNENPVGIALIYDHSKKEVWNNIIYGFQRGIYASVGKENSQTSIYNNTITAALFSGITPTGWPSVSYLYMKNNIVQGSAMNYDFSVIGAGVLTDYANNISEDATSPNTELHNKTVQFADEIGKDFHLAANDTAARGQGVNLYSDATTSVTTDIDGHARPSSGAFDIGADQGAAAIYYSVGQNTDSHETGDGNVSITSGVATFGEAQTATNMGIGDKLIAGGNTYYITGKTSTSIWNVRTATGSIPADLGATAVTSISHAFASLSDAEASSTDAAHLNTSDLSTNNYQLNIPCYYDSGPDTTTVTIDGYTTAVPNYIKIYTPTDTNTEANQRQRHWGKWDEGKYRLSHNSPYSYVLIATNPYIRIEGLQIENTCPKNNQPTGVIFNASATRSSDLRFSNNIVRSSGSGTEYTSGGLGVRKSGGLNAAFFNNLIINNTGILSSWDSINSRVAYYNNTIISDYIGELGISDNSGEGDYIFVKNNIVQGTHTDGDYGLWNGSENANNISSDATSPNSGSTDCGGHSCRNQDVQFADEANNDFHLALTDTAARNAGTNLATDTALAILTDIDGNGRPLPGLSASGGDIGADEASAEFAPTVMQSGGDFSSLSSWESANQVDLTAADTMVFSCASTSGLMPFNSSVTGTSSGATASSTVMSTTSNQILLYNITASSTGYGFEAGEKVYIQGGSTATNYCILSDSGNPAIAVAKIDGAWSAADTNNVIIDGWTTGPENYVKVYTTATARHNGKWDDNKYRLVIDEESLFLMEENVTVSGLQIYSTNSSSGYNGINADNYLEPNNIFNIIISFNIIKHTNPDSDGASGIFLGGDVGEGSLAKIYNNIIYDWGRSSNGYGIRSHGWYWDAYIYNNTVFNSYYGYSGSGNTPRDVLKNNIMQDCTDGFIQGYGDWNPATSFNISDIPGDAPGAHSATGTVAFIDAANYDFHLSPSDTAARNAGTNLVNDATSSFYTDIDGTARGSAWDIGADEVPVEYVSTICQNTSAGGDCANLDYTYLARWEDKVECDLTATSTRVFGGSVTGSLSENDIVALYRSGVSQNATGTIVATTSDQILIDNIIISGPTASEAVGPLDAPVNAQANDVWRKDASNYWTVATSSTHGGNDGLGASPIALAKIDGAWTASDTARFEVKGWTTDNDNNIKVYTASSARHSGKWDYAKYRYAYTATADWDYGIDMIVQYITLDGLQIEYNDGGHSVQVKGVVAHNDFSNNSLYVISNNIVRSTNSSTNQCTGISYMGAYTSNVNVFNNIVYGFTADGLNLSNNGMVNVYNNTFFNNRVGITVSGITAKNNLSMNNSDLDFYGSAWTNASSTNNISSDGTADDAVFLNGLANQSATSTFTDITNYDFHLKSGATAINAGADLSSDPYLIFTTDIDGGVRNADGLGWDIGADEVGVNLYRSVGTTATNLNTSNYTVTISGTTATFSNNMPNNIGVGDVLEYNPGSGLTLAFITARTSATVYSVQSSTGGTPNAATAVSVGVYRAYNSLNKWESQDENDTINDTLENFDSTTDLVASNTSMFVACYGDGVDTTAVTIDGWTTGENNYIKIYTPVTSAEVGTSQRHNGKWDTSRYYLDVPEAPGGSYAIYINDEYIKIDGLQINRTMNTFAGIGGIIFSALKFGDIEISNSIIKAINNINYYSQGILYNASNPYSTLTIKVWNNILYGWSGTNVSHSYGLLFYGQGKEYIYNNTIYNCDVGIMGTYFEYQGWGDTVIKNNNIQNCNNGYDLTYGFNPTSDYNISDIAGDTTGISPSYRSGLATDVTFKDETNKDFHLALNDTAARNAGTSSLSFPSGIGNPDIMTDIDGNGRSNLGVDIGADEGSTEFVTTIKQSGGDFSSLSQWENSNQVDLTATNTFVYSISSANGQIPVGSSVVGETSGANASSTIVATSSNQILLYNVIASSSGQYFLPSEKVYILGGATTSNYVILVSSLHPDPAIAVAKIDGAWTAADTNAVTINGWSTGPENYIKIYTTETARHQGKWDDTRYRIQIATEAHTLDIRESFTHVDGLQIKTTTHSESNFKNGICVYDPNVSGITKLFISNNIITSGNLLTGYGCGIYIDPHIFAPYYIWNNIIYDFSRTNDCAIAFNSDYGVNPSFAYNNTIVNCRSGIFTSYNRGKAVSNLVKGANNSFSGSFANGSNYNATDIDDNTIGEINTSSSDRKNQSFSFVNESSKDYHLSDSDTGAQDWGADLTNDPVWQEMCAASASGGMGTTSLDIDGDIRAQYSGWEIGADQLVTKIYRSVAPSATTTIASTTASGITLSVSSTTATFSANLPLNIGVGDVIQYDRDNNGSIDTIAFIHGRLSPSSYKVRNAYGALATTTVTADADWEIYRAYTSLYNAERGTENTGLNDTCENFDAWSNGKNIASSSEQWNIAAYANGIIADTHSVTIGDWTTGSTTFIRVYTPVAATEVGASQRHTGRWDEGSYHLSTIAEENTFTLDDDNISVDGLQMHMAHMTATGWTIALIGANSTVSNSIVRNRKGGNYENTGIWFGGNHASRVYDYAYNNIIYDAYDGIKQYYADNLTAIAYNNTVYNVDNNCYRHSADPGSEFLAKNNIAQNCSDVCFYGTFDSSSDFNLSDDGTAPGAHSATSTVLFTDIDADDFHLAPADTSAKDRGVSLLADAYLPFSTDIDGETRPAGETFDIGADEVYAYTKINTPPGSSNPPSLSDGLVGYWSFNGPDMDWSSTTAEALDRSGNSNSGNVIGAKQTEGVAGGQGMSFDGVDDYVDISEKSGFPVYSNSGYSISMWVKGAGGQNDQYVYSEGSGSSWFPSFNIGGDDTNGLDVFIRDDSNAVILNHVVSTRNVFDNTWHHFIWADSNGTVKLYVDGVEDETNFNYSPSTLTLNNSGLGAMFKGGPVDDHFFNGSIDEVRIYNRILSASEAQSLYKAGARKTEPNISLVNRSTNSNLILNLTFNGPDMDWSQTTAEARDRSGNNFHGNVISAKPIEGISGQALDYNGSSDTIIISQNLDNSLTDKLTASAWVNMEAVAVNGISPTVLRMDGNAPGNCGFFIRDRYNDDTKTYFEVGVRTDTYHLLLGATETAADNWYHVALVYDGENEIIYLNGSNNGQTPVTGNITLCPYEFYIGSHGSGDYLDGQIDEVRVYNSALAPAEIQDLYKAGARRVKIRK